MKLVFAHYRAITLELLRTPAYSVITVLLPGLIFLFIGPSLGDDVQAANVIMASFAIFAILGIAFFQFGVAIAQERESPWEAYQRTLPVSPATRFAARVLATLSFGLAAVVFVVVLALLTTPATLPAVAWLRLGLSVIAGGIVMSLFGIALGYSASPKAAVPIANLLYIDMSFGGGLFLPPQQLPDFFEPVSRVLPTRQFGELAWSAVLGSIGRPRHGFGSRDMPLSLRPPRFTPTAATRAASTARRAAGRRPSQAVARHRPSPVTGC